MTLLVITYFFPPMVSPRAFRWYSITKWWAQHGHEVTVICAGDPAGVKARLIPGLSVWVVDSRLDRLRTRLGAPMDGQSFRGWSVLQGMLKRVWQSVYWPDYACVWFGPALMAAERALRNQKYDALVTVSLPFTVHLIGWRLTRKFPYLPWIADIGDPFSFTEGVPQNNRFIYHWLNRLVEGRALEQTKAIVVTTTAARDRYAMLFPKLEQKVIAIPPICPSEELDLQDRTRVFPANDKIRLVFLGTLYREIRSPAFLLAVFDRLQETRLADRLELHFFGDVNDCLEFFKPLRHMIGRKIFLHGTVDRKHALKAMVEAHVLVNIGNATRYQLPSKVVEYACLGKPILNLVRDHGDSSEVILRTYPAAYTVLEQPLDRGTLESLVQFIGSPPQVPLEALADWRRPFTVSAVSEAYLQLMLSSSIP